MRRIYLALALVAAIAAGIVAYKVSDAKEEKVAPPAAATPAKSNLPAHFDSLSLDQDQLVAVERIRAKLSIEIEGLERKIRQIRLSEAKLIREVLLDAQLEKLERLEAAGLKPLSPAKEEIEKEKVRRQSGFRP